MFPGLKDHISQSLSVSQDSHAFLKAFPLFTHQRARTQGFIERELCETTAAILV